MERWLGFRTSKRAGFQKAACLGLKCIFLCALSSKQAWNCKQNSKPLWFHLIFIQSPLRFEWFNPKAVNLGRFTQNLVKGYLKELQTPKDVRELWLSLLLASNRTGGQGTSPGFSKLLGFFHSSASIKTVASCIVGSCMGSKYLHWIYSKGNSWILLSKSALDFKDLLIQENKNKAKMLSIDLRL